MPSLRQLQEIIQGMRTPYHKVDKSVIQDLNKQSDLVKLGVTSLVRCHREAVAVAATMGQQLRMLMLLLQFHIFVIQFDVADDGVVVSGSYTHAEVSTVARIM